MLGAIAGDIIGSRFEGWASVPADFDLFGTGCMFTDDTVCTIAVAHAVINDLPFAENIRSFARRYPMRGYGESFHKWVTAENAPRSCPAAWCNKPALITVFAGLAGLVRSPRRAARRWDYRSMGRLFPASCSELFAPPIRRSVPAG